MRGDPKTLPMKDDIPLFFFHGAGLLPPFASSEYLFEAGALYALSEPALALPNFSSLLEKLED